MSEDRPRYVRVRIDDGAEERLLIGIGETIGHVIDKVTDVLADPDRSSLYGWSTSDDTFICVPGRRIVCATIYGFDKPTEGET